MRQSPSDLTGAGSRSLWMRDAPPTYPDTLGEETFADVCIIGAGIAGLTTAYRLLLDGRRVLVVDGGVVGGGETLRTTAHLANALDDRFVLLERRHGALGAKHLAASHGYAIDWIESLCAEEKIECGFQRLPGFLFNGPTHDREYLAEELAASRRAGLSAEFVEEGFAGPCALGPCIRYESQAQFDPALYLAALAALVVRRGGEIHEGFVVDRLEDEGSPVRIIARGGRAITAKDVVVATNAPISSPASIPLRQSAYRSYVVTLEVASNAIPLGLYWDTEDPYHYVRLAPGRGRVDPTTGLARDVLIIGGEDHKTGQERDPAHAFECLYRWAERFGGAIRGAERWSGQIMEPADSVGMVGKNPGSRGNVYTISGDSGHGLTLGTLGAGIIADLLSDRPNPWATVYDPSRGIGRSIGTFLRENANVARQYLDLVKSGELPSERDVPRGEGAVIRHGATLLAVYRDETGSLHQCSAICPHLGGVVHWNSVERSWDCPCHGSRFDARGRVIMGPTTADLRPHAAEANHTARRANDPPPLRFGLEKV